MRVPFSLDDFLGVFRSYNQAIGIAPLLLFGLAIGLALMTRTKGVWRDRAIAAGLGVLWIWSGAAYHWAFFSRVNPAAFVFGAGFVLQGILFVAFGSRIRFAPRGDGQAALGWTLIVYAVVVYPIAGWMLGHGYPDGPTFGAPCPVTIFTIGMLLLIADRVPLALATIPLAWGLIGTSAAVQLGMREDFGLAVSAVILLGVIVRQRWLRTHSAGRASPPSGEIAMSKY